MSNPVTNWFWNDFESDPGLRACSAAAQGFWWRCLSMAARCPRVGYVSIDGVTRPSIDVLARSFSMPADDMESWIGELVRNRVCDLSAGEEGVEDGILINRKMKRAVERQAMDRANGRKGGNPALLAQRDTNLELLNAAVSDADKRAANARRNREYRERRKQQERITRDAYPPSRVMPHDVTRASREHHAKHHADAQAPTEPSEKSERDGDNRPLIPPPIPFLSSTEIHSETPSSTPGARPSPLTAAGPPGVADSLQGNPDVHERIAMLRRWAEEEARGPPPDEPRAAIA